MSTEFGRKIESDHFRDLGIYNEGNIKRDLK